MASPEQPVRTYDDLVLRFPDRTQWNLPAVLRAQARRLPDKVYLRVPATGETRTFAEIAHVAGAIAGGLHARGAQPGDRVAIMAENSTEYIEAWFGSAVAGLVEMPMNTAYIGVFLEHQVRLVEPRFAVVDPTFAERFAASREECRSIERFFVLDRDGADEAMTALRRAGWDVEPFAALRLDRPLDDPPDIDPTSLGAIFFTSGTTGLSKGVMMSNSQLHFYSEQGASLTKLTERDVYMSVGPLFHGNAQFLAAHPALIAGAEFVLQKRFSATRWAAQLEESGATVTNLVGVMMSFIWDQPTTGRDANNELRCVFSAPTASSIADAFKKRFGIEALVECFGMTEISLPVLTPYGEDRPAGAAGLLVADWFDVKIVDPETDEELPVGEVGELVVRNKVPFTMCSGYFKMPEATSAAMRNLWFHTGDGVRRDEEGWYYFVDRLKDYIRRRGENISSFEVEQPILEHPDVEECAVIGIKSSVEGGEDDVMACIVPRAGALPDPAALLEWCRERLPAFMLPRYIRFVDQLPRTPTEKIQKVKLREMGIDASTFDSQAG